MKPLSPAELVNYFGKSFNYHADPEVSVWWYQ
jgi:hypothetical protein